MYNQLFRLDYMPRAIRWLRVVPGRYLTRLEFHIDVRYPFTYADQALRLLSTSTLNIQELRFQAVGYDDFDRSWMGPPPVDASEDDASRAKSDGMFFCGRLIAFLKQLPSLRLFHLTGIDDRPWVEAVCRELNVRFGLPIAVGMSTFCWTWRHRTLCLRQWGDSTSRGST